MSESVFECPYCQSENIQSYNIAYASGFSNVSGVTTGVGVGMSGRVGVGVGNTVGTQQTVLSMMATPPKKKSTTSLFIMGTLGIYFGIVKVTIAKRYTYKKNYMAYISHIALFPIYSFLFYLGYISQQRLYCTCRLLF